MFLRGTFTPTWRRDTRTVLNNITMPEYILVIVDTATTGACFCDMIEIVLLPLTFYAYMYCIGARIRIAMAHSAF
jgi:hypothetical protein